MSSDQATNMLLKIKDERGDAVGDAAGCAIRLIALVWIACSTAPDEESKEAAKSCLGSIFGLVEQHFTHQQFQELVDAVADDLNSGVEGGAEL